MQKKKKKRGKLNTESPTTRQLFEQSASLNKKFHFWVYFVIIWILHYGKKINVHGWWLYNNKLLGVD